MTVRADPLGVRALSARTLEHGSHVQVGSLKDAFEAIRDLPVPAWDRRRHYTGERIVEYLFVLDTINFSFWGSGRGYWQLAEALRDAFARGEPLWEPEQLSSMTARRLRELVGDFPLLEERAAALRELGGLGTGAFQVSSSAVELARDLAGRLPSYADPFLKRAQILPADLWGAGAAQFPDLAELTCFADYKLPQALRHLNALQYSGELSRKIDNWVELPAGSEEETEIRAATVVAVDRLRDLLEEAGRPLLAIEVDWILWSYAQGLFPVRPYHRVRTVFY